MMPAHFLADPASGCSAWTTHPLSAQEGLELLKAQGLQAPDEALLKIIEQFGSDAGTLTLAGNYLREACNGDLSGADTIPIWDDPQVEGRPLRRIMAAFANWLHSEPELAILYLLSLFTEPVSQARLFALIPKPAPLYQRLLQAPRHEVFSLLRAVSTKKLPLLLKQTCRFGLISQTENSEYVLPEPVRAYFNGCFRSRFHESWTKLDKLVQAGHCEPDAPESPAPLAAETDQWCSPSLQTTEHNLARMAKRLEQHVQDKDWLQAARLATELRDGQWILGHFNTALQYARQSAAFSQLSGDQALLHASQQRLDKLLGHAPEALPDTHAGHATEEPVPKEPAW